MIRAGLTLFRRVIFAASLLILLICGAEVAVRIYEATSGCNIAATSDGICSDPSQLTIPSYYFHHELKPMATAKVECRDSKSHVEIRTNSRGLRNSELVVPKPTNVFRIVVLGDETIFAPETPTSDHFCTLLQNSLQQRSGLNIEVVNAGVPGHCPLTEFLLFQQRLIALQPDMVMLHFDWSDVADDRKIRRRARCDDAGIPQSCPHSQNAAAKKVRTHEIWRQQFRLLDWGLTTLSTEWKHQIARQKAVSRDADTNPYAWLRDENPRKNSTFVQAILPIKDLAALCRASNCSFVAVTSPKPWQVSAKCSRGTGVRTAAGVAQDACFTNRAPFNDLASFASKHEILFFDGSSAIGSDQDAETNFLKHAARWSKEGHRRMAEFVTVGLIEKTSGPWSRPNYQQNEQPISLPTPPNDPTIQWTAGQKPGPRQIVRELNRQLR